MTCRSKRTKTASDDLTNPLVAELVVPFLGTVDVGRLALVNKQICFHTRDRLFYEKMNSMFPQANSFPKDQIELILRPDVVKVPPAYVTVDHARNDRKSLEIVHDPRCTEPFDSMGYLDRGIAIANYGENFKVFYSCIPKPANAFYARYHFSEILSKTQAALASASSPLHDSSSGDEEGTSNNHMELVIDCVKERYCIMEASRLTNQFAMTLEIPLP